MHWTGERFKIELRPGWRERCAELQMTDWAAEAARIDKEMPMSGDKVEDIVMEHSHGLVGGPVPVLHTDDPKPVPTEQPKPEAPPAGHDHEQEVQVDVTVKPAEPAEKPDKD